MTQDRTEEFCRPEMIQPCRRESSSTECYETTNTMCNTQSANTTTTTTSTLSLLAYLSIDKATITE